MPDDIGLTPADGQVDLNTPPDGQGVPTPADSGQGNYFYSYTDPGKGEVKNFRNQDELNSYVGNLNKSYNELRSKFTKTTQDYADRNRTFENDRAAFLQQKQDFEKRRDEIAHLDTFLKQNPHVYRQIKQNMGKGPSGSDMQEIIDARIKEMYGSQLDELKSHKKVLDAERGREAAFKSLQQKYGDVDRDSIMTAFDKLSQGDLADVYELIHLSSRKDQAQAAKQNAGILPSGSGSPSSGPPQSGFKSIDDWVEAHQNVI